MVIQRVWARRLARPGQGGRRLGPFERGGWRGRRWRSGAWVPASMLWTSVSRAGPVAACDTQPYVAERRRPTCRNRENPGPTWRRVPGLAGGFVHSTEQIRRSAVPAEVIRQLFLGTATYSWRSHGPGRAIEADAKLDDQMPNSLLSHTRVYLARDAAGAAGPRVVQCRGYEVAWEACVPRLVAWMEAAVLGPALMRCGRRGRRGLRVRGRPLGVPVGGAGRRWPGPPGRGQSCAA